MKFSGIFLKVAMLFAGLTLLAACQTRDPRLVEALNSANVTSVRVEATPDVYTGLPMLNGITPEAQAAMIVKALETDASRKLKGLPGGAKAARLVITLQQADLASTPGRVLGGTDSFITGTVRLESVADGSVIAQNPRIVGTDHGVKGSGNIGFFVAMAINAAATKSQNALAEKLAASFTVETRKWLTGK